MNQCRHSRLFPTPLTGVLLIYHHLGPVIDRDPGIAGIPVPGLQFIGIPNPDRDFHFYPDFYRDLKLIHRVGKVVENFKKFSITMHKFTIPS